MMGDMFGDMSFDSDDDEIVLDEGLIVVVDDEEDDGVPLPFADECVVESSREVGYVSRNGAPILVRQIRERGLSFQLWPAASGLCWYLEDVYWRCWEGVGGEGGEYGLKGVRVLELGAGTGMVGVMAARLGADVTLTDLPHVVPNLVSNVELNCKEVEAAGGSLQVRSLRWGVQEDIGALGGPFDLILASDCVYYDALFEPLMQSLKSLCGISVAREVVDPRPRDVEKDSLVSGAVGAGAEPVVLLAHLRRWKKDSHFFRMAAKYFKVEIVHKHPPPGNDRIGVVVYKLTRNKWLHR